MGSSASTSAKIPAELQPLYAGTGQSGLALQKYYADPRFFGRASNFETEMPWAEGGSSSYFPYSYFGTQPPSRIRRNLQPAAGDGMGNLTGAGMQTAPANPVRRPFVQLTGDEQPTDWSSWYPPGNGGGPGDPNRVPYGTWNGVGLDPSVVWGFHSMPTAGMTPWEQYAGLQAAQLTRDPASEAQARGWAATMLGDAALTPQVRMDDPTIGQSLDVWRKYSGDAMRNQMNLMGLGSSTDKGAALAGAEAQVVLDALASQRTSQENAANRKMSAYQTGIGTLMEQGGRQRQSYLDFIEQMRGQGSLDRDLVNQQNQSLQNEILRHQALAEQSVYTPLGGFLPSALGSVTKSSGLFK